MRKAQTDDLVRRGMIIYGEGKSESEIRDKVERDPANFVREAIMEEAADEAQQAYAEAQSRARDVEMLVRSLNEVAAMFQDLANLVQHQSEMLNTIEENVESAVSGATGCPPPPGSHPRSRRQAPPPASA